jgi:hypothetical protein
MRRGFAIVAFVGMVLACAGPPPIQQAVVDKVASDLCGLGHPNGTFVSGEITDWSRGELSDKAHDRYVDVAIRYDRPNDPGHTMNVRLYLDKIKPCKVSIDVLDDDGPNPVLLDNGLASEAVGQAVCDAMTPG